VDEHNRIKRTLNPTGTAMVKYEYDMKVKSLARRLMYPPPPLSFPFRSFPTPFPPSCSVPPLPCLVPLHFRPLRVLLTPPFEQFPFSLPSPTPAQLECVAQGYADKFSSWPGHNSARTSDYATCGGSGYVGENWFSGSPRQSFGGFTGATAMWVDYPWSGGCSERDCYYGTRGCSGTDGHFTQVAWATSYKVGCGYKSGFGTVCNYSPGGNFNGKNPYTCGSTGDTVLCMPDLASKV
jgi:Cysteine-rich secretory protein family